MIYSPLEIILFKNVEPINAENMRRSRDSTLRKFRARFPKLSRTNPKDSQDSRGFLGISGDSKGFLRILGDSKVFSRNQRTEKLGVSEDSDGFR